MYYQFTFCMLYIFGYTYVNAVNSYMNAVILTRHTVMCQWFEEHGLVVNEMHAPKKSSISSHCSYCTLITSGICNPVCYCICRTLILC